MPLQIIRNDITKVSADAIVNTANPKVAVGKGTDFSVYTAAGWDRLLEERRKIGEMTPGQAAATPAFDLDARYIIHTVGPAWQDGEHGEKEAVAKCYRNSLAIAAELGCGSIAFPMISTGTYGFPKDEALKIAVAEISEFLMDHDMDVFIVVFDKLAFEISGKLFSDIEEYISDHYVEQAHGEQRKAAAGYLSGLSNEEHFPQEAPAEKGSLKEYDDGDFEVIYDDELTGPIIAKTMQKPVTGAVEEEAPLFPSEVNIDDFLKKMDKSFSDYLFDLIDRSGMKDPDVYKKANIDRKLFSKIRSNPDYRPSKRTAVALAIALELNLDETLDLLKKVGYTLSDSDIFDLIIRFFIERGEYDINEINCALYKYDQPLLGA
ncbi:MAG: macro domain-containing protein [Bacillota bacterium]|nr:macro domain-containing protein [Bacillota bacterium]